MTMQWRKNLKHCHPETLECPFQLHQYFVIIFILSLVFTQTLPFLWTLGNHIFVLQIAFQGLNGIITALNLVSFSKLFITKLPHATFLFNSPSRSFEIQNSKYQFISELFAEFLPKKLQSKIKSILILHYGKVMHIQK